MRWVKGGTGWWDQAVGAGSWERKLGVSGWQVRDTESEALATLDVEQNCQPKQNL